MRDFKEIFNTPDYTDKFTKEDIKENSLIAYLCYCTVFCLIPLLIRKNSPYTRFHTNQGLMLMIIHLVGMQVFNVLSWIPILSGVFRVLKLIYGLLCFVIALLGVVNVTNGKAKELPLFGFYRLLND